MHRRLNPASRQSFQRCRKEEPIALTYKGFIPLIYRFNPRAKKISISLKENIAVATIPSTDLHTIAKALQKHIEENLSQTSILRGMEKLQKALDLAVLTLLLNKMGFERSLTIALHRIMEKHLSDKDVKRLYDVVLTINCELKSRNWLEWFDRRFLRIILLEMYKLEIGIGFGMVT